MSATINIEPQIRKALAAHSLWKVRLKDAIDYGSTEFTPSLVEVDNNCEFGKWLCGNPELKESHPAHYERVRALHAQFHKEVAHILRLAQAGKKEEAKQAMAAGTVYSNLTTDLTREMMAWDNDAQ